MRQDYEKLFRRFEPAEPAAELFDRIILAIKREQELRNTDRQKRDGWRKTKFRRQFHSRDNPIKPLTKITQKMRYISTQDK